MIDIIDQMAFYLGVAVADIKLEKSSIGLSSLTIEIGDVFYDVFFDCTGMVMDYLLAE